METESEGEMKPLILGSLLVVFCGVNIFFYLEGVELRSVSHWGIHCEPNEKPIYRGPTGDNHSVEVYRPAPYKWLDGRGLWD